MNWQPIETVPEDELILVTRWCGVFYRERSYHSVVRERDVFYKHPNKEIFYTRRSGFTHWAPLAPPETSNEN